MPGRRADGRDDFGFHAEILVKYGSMRNIRVIIAFLSVYLFVSAVVLLGLFAVWLSRFYPDSSSQSILTIDSVVEIANENTFTISKSKNGVTALSATVTRLNEKNGMHEQIARITSSTIFVDFHRVTFSEKLVPLGYFSMVQVVRISDAEGKVILELQPDFLDLFWLVVLKRQAETKTERLTFVAKDNATSYTVQHTTAGVVIHEN